MMKKISSLWKNISCVMKIIYLFYCGFGLGFLFRNFAEISFKDPDLKEGDLFKFKFPLHTKPAGIDVPVLYVSINQKICLEYVKNLHLQHILLLKKYNINYANSKNLISKYRNISKESFENKVSFENFFGFEATMLHDYCEEKNQSHKEHEKFKKIILAQYVLAKKEYKKHKTIKGYVFLLPDGRHIWLSHYECKLLKKINTTKKN